MSDALAALAAAGPVAGALLGLAAGAVLGAFHFGSLWWNARLFAEGGALKAFGLQLARLAVLLAALAGLAHLGAPALLGGAGGLLLARAVLVRRLGRAP